MFLFESVEGGRCKLFLSLKHTISDLLQNTREVLYVSETLRSESTDSVSQIMERTIIWSLLFLVTIHGEKHHF